MKNEVSIVDLAGALTLPLVSELFAANSMAELNALFHQLDLLYENNCHSLAFDIICDLFRKTGIEFPYIFYEMVETTQDNVALWEDSSQISKRSFQNCRADFTSIITVDRYISYASSLFC